MCEVKFGHFTFFLFSSFCRESGDILVMPVCLLTELLSLSTSLMMNQPLGWLTATKTRSASDRLPVNK